MQFTLIKDFFLGNLARFGKRATSLWSISPVDDNLKNRRNLAFWSAIYALVLWPHELVYLRLAHDLDIDLIKALLVYVATLAGTSIGGYLWACLKDDAIKKETSDGKPSD